MRLTGLTLPILLGALLIQVVTVGTKQGACPTSLIPSIGNVKRDCDHDRDCNGTQKCCWEGYTHLCKDPEVIKPGVCPLSLTLPTDCRLVIPLEDRICTEDLNCTGTQKCCLYACQYSCKDPVVTKPGVCPRSSKPCLGNLKRYCQSDECCNGTQKCCRDGCNFLCKDPAVMTQRVCPLSLEPCSGKRKLGCMNDENCVGTQMCCQDGCEVSCKDPAVIKPGKCPRSPTPDTSCPSVIPMKDRNCTRDQNCNGTQKCCFYDCQYLCKEPIEINPGKCPEGPKPLSACYPWRHGGECQSDMDCDGGKKCCLYDCWYSCREPVDGDGGELTQFYKKEEKNLVASSQ